MQTCRDNQEPANREGSFVQIPNSLERIAAIVAVVRNLQLLSCQVCTQGGLSDWEVLQSLVISCPSCLGVPFIMKMQQSNLSIIAVNCFSVGLHLVCF